VPITKDDTEAAGNSVHRASRAVGALPMTKNRFWKFLSALIAGFRACFAWKRHRCLFDRTNQRVAKVCATNPATPCLTMPTSVTMVRSGRAAIPASILS